MNLSAAIEALRAELRAIHGEVDDSVTIGIAMGGLAVLSALARGKGMHDSAALDTISATYPQPPALDTRRMGQDVLAALSETDRAIVTAAQHALDAATETPEPPQPHPAAAPDAPPPEDRGSAPDTARHASDAPGPASPAQAPPRRPPAASWTPERRALLPRYATEDLAALLAEMNALPGEPLTMKALMNRAFQAGIKRAPDARAKAKSTAMRQRMANPEDLARQAHNARAVQAKASQAAAAARLAQRAPEPAPEPTAPSKPPRVWTEERLDLAEAMYTAGDDLDAILAAINARPGPATTRAALEGKIRNGGWKRASRAAQQVAALAPPDEPLTTEELHEAREMVRKGKGARDLSHWFGGGVMWWGNWMAEERAKKERAA